MLDKVIEEFNSNYLSNSEYCNSEDEFQLNAVKSYIMYFITYRYDYLKPKGNFEMFKLKTDICDLLEYIGIERKISLDNLYKYCNDNITNMDYHLLPDTEDNPTYVMGMSGLEYTVDKDEMEVVFKGCLLLFKSNNKEYVHLNYDLKLRTEGDGEFIFDIKFMDNDKIVINKTQEAYIIKYIDMALDIITDIQG